MRVVHVVRTASFGGAEIQALRCATAQRALGADVVLVVPPGTALEDAARRARLPVAPSHRGAALPAGDVVHVHEPRDLVLACLRAGRRPVVMSRHLAPSTRRRRDPYHAWLTRRVCFVAASVFVRDALCAAYGLERGRVSVVPYGIGAPAATAPPEPPRHRGGTRVLGVVARLTPRKHLGDAVELLARLVRAGRDVRLRVAGEETTPGARLALLERVRAEGLVGRVELLGHRVDVPELLAGFDLLVHPTPAESFGLAPLEAMAVGLPVVAVASGGLPEVVEDGRTGLLAPAGDGVALAAAVAALLDDPVRARALGEAGRARVRERFGAAREARELLDLYTALASGGPHA